MMLGPPHCLGIDDPCVIFLLLVTAIVLGSCLSLQNVTLCSSWGMDAGALPPQELGLLEPRPMVALSPCITPQKSPRLTGVCS
jgi:hypothetical protein